MPKQATTTMENRLEKGEETQMRLFGPQMKDFAKKGLLINGWWIIVLVIIIRGKVLVTKSAK